MKRPLLAHERLAVHLAQEEGLGEPAVANLVASLAFLLGQVIGGYPTGQAQFTITCDDAVTVLQVQIALTVPLKELGEAYGTQGFV